MEISHVSGHHRELVHLGNGCNHRVLVERVGLAMHQLGPASEGQAIHGEDVEGVAHLIEPKLDLTGFARILFACEFDASLDLADGHAGEMEIDVIGALQPSEHSAMGPWSAQEQDDPYAVSPEDALDAARREVKAWRMEKLTSGSRRAQLDPLTEWFVLAWDAFQAPQFPYDEALRLARVVGLDLDKDVVGVLAEKKTSDLILWDSSTRAIKGKLGAPDGTKSSISPKNDPEPVVVARRQFVDDQRQRNAVEGKIDQGKRRFRLGLIREKLAATQDSAIAMTILEMNLERLLL